MLEGSRLITSFFFSLLGDDMEAFAYPGVTNALFFVETSAYHRKTTFVQYFDKEGDGEVPYELFLRSIRAAMPSRRLALAHQAFDRMGEFSTAQPKLFVTFLASSGADHDVAHCRFSSGGSTNGLKLTSSHLKPAGCNCFRSFSFLRSVAWSTNAHTLLSCHV